MARRRINISIALMVIAILAIAFFQCYWLRKTYKDELQTLNIRANVLFRESIYELQARRVTMEFDGSVNITQRLQAVRVIDNVRSRLRAQDSTTTSDSLRRPPQIVLRTNRLPDSGLSTGFFTMPKMRTFNRSTGPDIYYEIFQGVDLLHDSVTIPEITARLKGALDKEKIKLDFTIIKEKVDSTAFRRRQNLELSNDVIIGFAKPVKFKLELHNARQYVFRKIYAQILISILLVGLTTISFVVLFRNLVRQRRLTQLKNDFISNITHELRTPIATVSVAVEALKSFNALDDAKRTQEYLSISANELQRLSLLVDKVLKLSMFEKQEIELKNEDFDLKQLIEEVVASMKLQFEKYGAAIRLNLPASPAILNADRLHITSVVYNLLDNALKYSIDKPVIEVGITETVNLVNIQVRDNGPGIPAGYKDKIFEKFFRVPTGDHHNVKGYGLGLSYVAYVIQRHRGSIALETVSGAGSTFIVTLPKH
jgi:two-component system, OmpR family, phosphate regulon sensor histidine kinase PhoR